PPAPTPLPYTTLFRSSDYLAAMRMLSVPVIVTGVMIGIMVHLGNSLQSSFYVVYLNGIGISGTAIGLLFSAFSICAAAGSLIAGDRKSTRLNSSHVKI